ncbi:cytochrome D1 domain-containing protein [Thalassotalea psychrophila]|uniref:Cytochrome D1 domain-containing protein n=1 Tax=Thalassotalea psychrophila TaxID=3065647 RepID=A0ABY9TUZ7_9GAMM|nr:cytochrome D1 domain-containing protein [Colwelliaceae bacterium SQ149]
MTNTRTKLFLSLLLPLFIMSCQQLQDTAEESATSSATTQTGLRATGDLGLVIERATGQVKIVNHSDKDSLAEIDGLGDLSHASIVYSRDQRFGYVFGRDGGLTKIDLLKNKIDKRVIQSGNSIGGAISQNGKFVAVSNYSPGGVKIFASDTLELVADIPATELMNHPRNKDGSIKRSKVVGLVDAPGQKFVFSLFDSHEIWIADLSKAEIELTKYTDIGLNPYDALISPDGRYYIAGLFGEDGMALLDLWSPEQGVKRILDGYGKGEKKLPVYKMPHLEGWAMAGNFAYVPAVGLHQVLIIDTQTWQQVGAIDVHGQPVFVMAQPDNRQVWINFAFPLNDTIQIIDTKNQKLIKTLTPGPGVLHMEFTPRGEDVWMSVRDNNEIQIYNSQSFELLKKLPAKSPSGIFFTNRAHQIGL